VLRPKTKAKVDLTDSHHMVIVAITLVFGLGGMFLQTGSFQLQGIALSTLVAILLKLMLPKIKLA
jgi:uracil permease